MTKHMGFIVVAAFLLSILVGVFWNQIIQVDAIADSVAIIFGLILLSVIVRGCFTSASTGVSRTFLSDLSCLPWARKNLTV